jgi:hypothetical protein
MNIIPETIHEVEAPEYLSGYDVRLGVTDKTNSSKEIHIACGALFPATVRLPKHSILQITINIELKPGVTDATEFMKEKD